MIKRMTIETDTAVYRLTSYRDLNQDDSHITIYTLQEDPTTGMTENQKRVGLAGVRQVWPDREPKASHVVQWIASKIDELERVIGKRDGTKH